MNRTTITLENDAFSFLSYVAKDNRSAYINALILKEKSKQLEEAIKLANKEEAEDAAYQNELSDWDSTLNDGLPESI
jgi:hypothetical protein